MEEPVAHDVEHGGVVAVAAVDELPVRGETAAPDLIPMPLQHPLRLHPLRLPSQVMQLIHQVLHFVWADVVVYFEQPEGLISLATGPQMPTSEPWRTDS